ADAELLEDQVSDRGPGPEGRGDPHFIRAVRVDQVPDALGLLVIEGAAGAGRATGAIAGQGVAPAAPVGGVPPRDGRARDPGEGAAVWGGVTGSAARGGAARQAFGDLGGKAGGMG